MPTFTLIENCPSVSKYKYTIACSNKKCSNEFQRNDIYFCYFDCVCGKKMLNPKHAGYHTRNRCLFELKSEIETELEKRKKPAEVKDLKHPKLLLRTLQESQAVY